MSESNTQEIIKTYFEQELPQAFAASVAANPPQDLEGAEFLLVYDLDGEKYGLRVTNGTNLEVLAGGLENPQIYVTLSKEAVTDIAENRVKVNNPVIDYNTRKRLDKIKSLKGLFQMALTKEDGSLFESSTVFNGVSEPAVKIKAKANDYAAVTEGKLNSQMAFLTGKVKFEGSMPFLMVLSTLNQ